MTDTGEGRRDPTLDTVRDRAAQAARPVSTAEGATSVFDPAYRLISLAIVATVTIIAFEFMAIATAMPAAAEELGALRSYGLAFSVMLTAQLLGIVVAGVWSDVSGPMPGLYAGQLLFAAGAAVCGLATSFPVLLLGRVVTGLGAGLVVVVLYVVIGRVYPADVRPRVFAWVSAAWVLPSLVGAPLAGWLTTTFTWRLVFWVVVPPALVTLAMLASQRSAIAERRPRGPAATGGTDGSDADPADTHDTHDSDDGTDDATRAAHRRTASGGVLIAVAAGLVQLGTSDSVSTGPWQAVAAVVGVVGLVLVTPRLLPPGTLRMARGLPSVIVSRFLLNAAFNGAITYLPLMVTQERGETVFVAGAVLAVGSFGWSTGSWLQGQARFTGRRSALVAVGGALLAAGTLVMVAVVTTDVSVWVLGGATVLAGLGMGLGSTSLSVLVLDLVPVEGQSAASASLQLSDVLGSVLGIAAAGAVFSSLHLEAGERSGYVVIWVGLACVAAVVAVSGRRCRPLTAPGRGPAAS